MRGIFSNWRPVLNCGKFQGVLHRWFPTSCPWHIIRCSVSCVGGSVLSALISLCSRLLLTVHARNSPHDWKCKAVYFPFSSPKLTCHKTTAFHFAVTEHAAVCELSEITQLYCVWAVLVIVECFGSQSLMLQIFSPFKMNKQVMVLELLKQNPVDDVKRDQVLLWGVYLRVEGEKNEGKLWTIKCSSEYTKYTLKIYMFSCLSVCMWWNFKQWCNETDRIAHQNQRFYY